VLAEARVGGFEPGLARDVELWYVDQEVSLWVGGAAVLKKGFEVGYEEIRNRNALPPNYTPTILIRVKGSTTVLHRADVDRDLYYSSSNQGVAALGGVVKTGSVKVGEPVVIEADQFYCMGDNSPLSNDSRYWDQVNDWVLERMLKDRRLTVGIVPRDLMIGRAFFVYWPAVHRSLVIPNFGDMRFIH
jgi:signal peptidase I